MTKLLFQSLPLPLGQAFDECGLTHNSSLLPASEFPKSGDLTPHTAFQNRPSETQEPEAHVMLQQRAPATVCADSRARERDEDSRSILNEKVKLQSPVICIS